jgi:dTDP-glucose 4,6-dehydratase
LTLVNCLEGRPLSIYGDGRQVRDWLYVEDHCRGIDAVLEHGQVGETYNLGGNCELANIDVVRRLCELVNQAFLTDPSLKKRFPHAPPAEGRRCEELTCFVADRPGHDRRYAVNASRAQNDLGFSPKETFDSGLRRTVDWYLANEPWWRAIQDGTYRDWMAVQYPGAMARK